MAFLTVKNVAIRGVSAAVPKGVKEIRECEFFAPGEAEKVISLTKVERSRIVRDGQCCSDLCYEAAEKLIAELTDEADISKLVESVPKLDGVFFCAGITDTTLVKFMSRDKIERVINVNLLSPMLLTKQLFAKKKINKNASLVYMSSYGAERVTPGLGIYSTSKMGLNAFVHAVAIENAARHIRANSIMPMMVQTELVDTMSAISQEEMDSDRAKYPFGYGTPQDVAYAAIYLLSDASKWVTGTQIRMDGGSAL